MAETGGGRCSARSTGLTWRPRRPPSYRTAAHRARTAGGAGRRRRRALLCARKRVASSPSTDGAAADGRCPGPHVAVRAVLDVLDAELSLSEAVETGRVDVHGSLDDVVHAHDALLAYAHAAVRAPSVPGLVDGLRCGGGGRMTTSAQVSTPASRPPSAHCGRPGRRDRRPDRGPRAGGARLRRHRLRAACGRAGRAGPGATRRVPARQARGPRRVPVLHTRPHRWQPGAAPTVPRPAAASRGRRSGRWPASTGSASSRPTTCTSGICCSAFRSTCPDAHGRRGDLATDVSHGHGQRPPGDHPGHHRGGQAVVGLLPRGTPQPGGDWSPRSTRSRDFGFSPSDAATFLDRLMRYLVTSPLRRDVRAAGPVGLRVLHRRRRHRGARRFTYTPAVREAHPRHAQDPRRLRPAVGRRPHQHHHLPAAPAPDEPLATARPTAYSTARPRRRGSTTGTAISSPSVCASSGPRWPTSSPRRRPVRTRRTCGRAWSVVLADGTRLAPDYVVAAVDPPAAERLTDGAARGGHGRRGGRGWTGSPPRSPHRTDPLQPAPGAAGGAAGSPYAMDEMGRVPWDRFQTLAGIQYYFDTEFQLVRGHVYYSGDGVGPVVHQPARTVGAAADPRPRRATSPCSRSTSAISTRRRGTSSTSTGGARRPATAPWTSWPRRCGGRSSRTLTSGLPSPPEDARAAARLVRRRPEPGDVGGPGGGDGRPRAERGAVPGPRQGRLAEPARR